MEVGFKVLVYCEEKWNIVRPKTQLAFISFRLRLTEKDAGLGYGIREVVFL